MDQKIYDDLVDQATMILEPNATYWRADILDTRKYFLGPEVISDLAEKLIAFVLPILANVTTSYLNDRLKKKSPPQSQIGTQLNIDTINIYNNASSKEEVTSGDMAIEKVRQELMKHGWPETEAEKSADQIISLVVATQKNNGQ